MNDIWIALFEFVPLEQGDEPFGVFCQFVGRADSSTEFVKKVDRQLIQMDYALIDVDDLYLWQNADHSEYAEEFIEAVRAIDIGLISPDEFHRYPLV